MSRVSKRRAPAYDAAPKRVRRSSGVYTPAGTNDLPFRRTVRTTYRTDRKELKATNNLSMNGAAGLTAGVPGAICINIPEGNDYNQREGRLVRAEDCVWHGIYSFPATSGINYNLFVRIICFKWKQSAVNPVPANILDPVSIYASYSQQYASQYQILHDKVYTLTQSATSTQDIRQYISGKTKLGFDMEFGAGANGYSTSDSPWLICITSDNVGTFTIRSTMRFTDI